MPTYQYECAKCGHQFEVFQSMKDNALEVCPKDKCPQKRWGKGKIRRQLGVGAGIIFKGSGFYITDYRSDSYKAGAKKDSESSSSSSSSSSKKADTPSSSSNSTSKSDSKPKPSAT
ncbi:MAG: zinc ribbon domain-containing protein [Verrucomicrobiales bacterium]|nr:zinc ribbon domain-containing protein [Verrucomicrobiales bacterium]